MARGGGGSGPGAGAGPVEEVGGAEGDERAVGQLLHPAAGIVVGQGAHLPVGQDLPPGAGGGAELELDAGEVDGLDLGAAGAELDVDEARRAGGLVEDGPGLLGFQEVVEGVKALGLDPDQRRVEGILDRFPGHRLLHSPR